MTETDERKLLYRSALRHKIGLFLKRPSAAMFYMRLIAETFVGTKPDAWIVSYPKSGRTWLERLLVELLRERLGIPADRHPLLQIATKGKQPLTPHIAMTHRNSSWEGRVLSCEELAARGAVVTKNARVVFLYRDPRDVLVSSFHHMRYRTGIEEVDAETLVESNFVGVRKVVTFLNIWAQYARDNPGRCFQLSYEQLRLDPDAHLARLCEFLGIETDGELIAHAVYECSFERMQERERSGAVDNPRLAAVPGSDERGFKARRGRSGEYLEFFTPEQRARLDAVLRDELDPSFGYGPGDATQ